MSSFQTSSGFAAACRTNCTWSMRDKEGHDFTAPDFFTSVQVKNNDALSESGNSVFLHPEKTTDIYFIAQNAGLFAPRCTDHDWAGMTTTIVID